MPYARKEAAAQRCQSRRCASRWVIFSALALVMMSGCRGATDVAPSPGKVLLIGVDGLEWQVVLDLIREERLPVLTQLMREGSFGRLETLTPTESPIIWTTVATGKLPEKHGIGGFVKPAADGRSARLYSNGDRRTKALWNISSDYQRTVHSIGWWMTFPAEPINGTMVAQTNAQGQITPGGAEIPWKGGVIKGLDGQVSPVELQDRVIDIARETERDLARLSQQAFGAPPNRDRRAWQQSQWSFRADSTYLRVTQEILNGEQEPPDLLMVYFGNTDVMSHRFWRYAYPDGYRHPPTPRQVASLSHLVADAYIWVDRAIGEILEHYDETATVIVASDHGMGPDNLTLDFTTQTRATSGHHPSLPGVLIVSGGHARRSGFFDDPALQSEDLRPDSVPIIGGVVDIAPTILALLGVPVGRDMDGVVLEEVFAEGFAARFPISFVDTHDSAAWLGARPGQLLSDEASEERLQQLRALGYIR